MGTPTINFCAKKCKKNVFPCLNPSLSYKRLVYKVLKIVQACFHDKAVLETLPSNLIKEMYNLLIILFHLKTHKCDFAFMASFPYSLVLDSYIPL